MKLVAVLSSIKSNSLTSWEVQEGSCFCRGCSLEVLWAHLAALPPVLRPPGFFQQPGGHISLAAKETARGNKRFNLGTAGVKGVRLRGMGAVPAPSWKVLPGVDCDSKRGSSVWIFGHKPGTFIREPGLRLY